MKKFLVCMMVLLAVTGCEPSKSASNKEICVPSGTTAETKDAEGNTLTKLEAIEKYLKEQQIVSTIVGTVKQKLLGDNYDFTGAQTLFQGIADSYDYQGAVAAAFSLYVIIYGIAIIGGLVQATVGDAAIRIAKMAVIGFFAANWDEFYLTIGAFFINGMDELIAFFLGAFKDLYYLHEGADFTQSNTDVIFGDLDIFVSRIFSPHTIALVSAVMSSSPGNIALAGLIGFSLVFLMIGVFRVVMTYVFAVFALALLFAIAPIFLTFMLFNQTKPLFDNWINMLINYSLQPVFVCAFIGLYAGLLAPFLQDLLQYKLCYGDVGRSNQKSEWYFVNPNDPSNQRVAFSPSSEPPIGWQTGFLFFIFSWLFGANVKFAAQLSSSISPSWASDLTGHSSIWKHVNSANPDKNGGIMNLFKSAGKST